MHTAAHGLPTASRPVCVEDPQARKVSPEIEGAIADLWYLGSQSMSTLD